MRIGTIGTAIVLIAAGSAAALSCNDKAGRYVNRNVFASAKQTANIPFGSNKNPLHNNATEALATDFYQPNGDTCAKRPLVLFMWGGGFQGGSRQGEDGTCRQFAQRGFACATIDYRKGNPGSYNIRNFCGPTFMSTQDTRAAIRFYRKNAATYGIDTANIYVGGCSSGAYAAMHTAYLDEENEIPAYIPSEFTVGGIEGNSGNPGFSSAFAGVLSLSGGLFDSTWVKRGSIPAAAVYCTKDDIESPDSLHDGSGGRAFVSNYDAARLGPRFTHMGVPLLTKAYNQACHCPHFTDASGADETVDFLAKSAYKFMTTPTTAMRPAVAFSPRDLSGDGAWSDLNGRKLGESDARRDFRPGIYFPVRPVKP